MLPIHAVLEPLKAALVAGNSAVLAAPPGAGNSTISSDASFSSALCTGSVAATPRCMACSA